MKWFVERFLESFLLRRAPNGGSSGLPNRAEARTKAPSAPEVKMKFSNEYDEERYWNDVWEDGIEVGVQKGKIEILADLVESGDLSASAAAKKQGVTVPTFKKKVKELARAVG